MPTAVLPRESVSLVTTDLDEVTETVSRLFGHHVVMTCGQATAQRQVQARPLSGVMVGSIAYASDMSCLCDQPRDPLIFTLPRDCHGSMGAMRFGPDDALAFVPEWVGRLELGAPGGLWNTCIPRDQLLLALRALLGTDPDGVPAFQLHLPADSPAARRVRQVLQILHESTASPPLLQRAREQWALLELLAVWPHSLSPYLFGQHFGPRTIRRALDHIESHLDQPLPVEDIARAACVGTRALTQAFQRELGETPGQYVRRRRLECAWAQLSTGTSASVTEVALQWQFSNPGMFAQYFRRQFGCLPSDARRVH